MRSTCRFWMCCGAIGDSEPEEHAAEQTLEVTRSWLVEEPVTVTQDSGLRLRLLLPHQTVLELVDSYPSEKFHHPPKIIEFHTRYWSMHCIFVHCRLGALYTWCIVDCCICV